MNHTAPDLFEEVCAKVLRHVSRAQEQQRLGHRVKRHVQHERQSARAAAHAQGRHHDARMIDRVVGEQTAEVDIYLDDLAGLGVADFEFDSREAMDKLAMPDFCLIDVTQEEMIAGGILAGKTYADLEKFLQGIGYEKITSD